MSEPKSDPTLPADAGNLLGLLNRNGINTVVLVCALGSLFVGYHDVAELKEWRRDHEQVAQRRRDEVDKAIQAMALEQVAARERHAAILAAMARMEKQLENSTVVVRAGGRIP